MEMLDRMSTKRAVIYNIDQKDKQAEFSFAVASSKRAIF